MGTRTDEPFPGPWRFGFRNVIADRDGRYIVSNVPVNCGPLLAAGPTLVAVLERISTLTEPGTPAHETAVNAVESFHEREAITLADWNPPAAVRGLRIVGTAK